jgi:large subunit ribosomal protein L21
MSLAIRPENGLEEGGGALDKVVNLWFWDLIIGRQGRAEAINSDKTLARAKMFGSAQNGLAEIESFLSEVRMYAVIKTGGKQYRVSAGEKIKVEQIAADVGQEIVIDQVLAVGNGAEIKVGTPLVSGASVKAMVLAHGKHDKVHIFKMRRRKHYQKRQGHRQQFTELQIASIQA